MKLPTYLRSGLDYLAEFALLLYAPVFALAAIIFFWPMFAGFCYVMVFFVTLLTAYRGWMLHRQFKGWQDAPIEESTQERASAAPVVSMLICMFLSLMILLFGVFRLYRTTHLSTDILCLILLPFQIKGILSYRQYRALRKAAEAEVPTEEESPQVQVDP